MLAAQGGKCAICESTSPGGRWNKNFFVDHEHDSGRVRALLCHNCNAGIGHFFDDIERLRKAIAYLEWYVKWYAEN